MSELTNAQVALQCATELKQESHNPTSVLYAAEQFKKWLDENTRPELKK